MNSAMSGAAEAFLSFAECKVILYSPMWCASIVERNLSQVYPDIENRLFGTFTEEKDLLFGGKEKLQYAVEEVIDSGKPGVLGIAVNCGPALIGDDVESICLSSGINNMFPVAVADASGFDGEADAGWANAMIALLKKIDFYKKTESENSINIIGASVSDQKTERWIAKLTGVLLEQKLSINSILGIKENYFEALPKLGKAKLNLIVHPRGERVGNWFQDNMEKPYILAVDNDLYLKQKLDDFFMKKGK